MNERVVLFDYRSRQLRLSAEFEFGAVEQDIDGVIKATTG